MRKILIIFLVSTVLLSSGCWNRKELNEIDFILGAGMDFKDDQLVFAAHVVRASILAADSPTDPGFITYSSTGPTFFEAVRNITLHSSNKLFWGHQQIMIVGMNVMKESLMDVRGFLPRDHETSRHTLLVGTEEDVEEFLQEHVALKALPMMELRSVVENYSANGKVVRRTLHDFIKDNYSPGLCSVITMVKLQQNDGFKVYAMDGTALIKNNEYIGKLTPDETRGLLWLLNEIDSTVLSIDITETALKEQNIVKEVAYEVIGAKTQIISEGNLKYTVKTDVHVSFGEDNFRERLMRPEEDKIIEQLQKKAADMIQKEMEHVVEITKELKTDSAGFGRAMYRQQPKDWRQYEQGWRDDHYPNIEISYEVNVKQIGRMMYMEMDPQKSH